METVTASDVWYMNASFLNETSTDQPARIRIRDKQNILERRRPYMVAVSRFTVSGNTTLYYRPSNPDATCSIKFYEDHGQSWTYTRTAQVSLENHSYTISELLGQLNEKTTGTRVKFAPANSRLRSLKREPGR